MKKGNIGKFLSTLLVCTLCLFLMPMHVMASGDDPAVKNGYYDETGTWKEGELQQELPEGMYSVNKTAVKTGENTYDITLEVVTEQNLSTVAKKAAVILVIDTSRSMASNNRLNNAKKAAIQFIDGYTENTEGSERYLAIVDFATGVDIRLRWTDISTATGKLQAIDTINALYSNGGTNLHAGLKQAEELLKDTVVADLTSDEIHTIVLTDGEPTYYIRECNDPSCEYKEHITIANVRYDVLGGGSHGNETINRATAAQAKVLQEKSKVHTVCYGAGADTAAYLQDEIASTAENEIEYAHNADNVEDLIKAFASITETITSGLDGKDLIVTDGFAPFVSVQLPDAVTETDDSFAWKLTDAQTSIVGDKTYYTYRLTYTVTLDVNHPDFKEETWYPLNGETYITMPDGKKVPFPIPAGQGVKSRYTITYTDGVEGEVIFADQTTTNVIHGDKTPGFEGIPERDGYIFDGWTPEVKKTVTESVIYKATWLKKQEAVNTAPVIEASDKVIHVGDIFDPLEDVRAMDEEDGDISDKIEVIHSTVDTSKVGVYEVTYQVTDSEGASTLKTIKVEVKEALSSIIPVKPIDGTAKPVVSDHKESTVHNNDVPETGDTTYVGLWLSIVILTGGAVFIAYRKRKHVK